MAQPALDKGLEVSIEYIVDVTGFMLGSMILDHLVRMQDIGANLAAKSDIALGALESIQFFPALALLCLQDASSEHSHRLGPVGVLRAFVLALHDDPRGDVSDPDRGIGGVDVLPSRTAGSIGIDSKIGLSDLDSFRNVGFRNHSDRGEGGLASRLCIKRRDPNDAMNSRFSLEIPVGIVTDDVNRR